MFIFENLYGQYISCIYLCLNNGSIYLFIFLTILMDQILTIKHKYIILSKVYKYTYIYTLCRTIILFLVYSCTL